jgi:uncharacterized protein (TIGR02646 family)
MIRITRPSKPPEVLLAKGKKRRRSHVAAYTRAEGRAPTKTSKKAAFAFDRDIYAHPTVKQALERAQHGKCCFCESKVAHITAGDVEHFRPKAGWRQQDDGPLEQPGYYWLAYDWTNLLFACDLCNRRHKRNAFPLRDPKRRARTHRDSVTAEEPLFIDPAGAVDPETLISFHEEVAFPVDDNEAGRETIRALGLNRAALAERRREQYKAIQTLHKMVHALPPEARAKMQAEVADAEAFLRRGVKDDAEYAAMARAALKTLASEATTEP